MKESPLLSLVEMPPPFPLAWAPDQLNKAPPPAPPPSPSLLHRLATTDGVMRGIEARIQQSGVASEAAKRHQAEVDAKLDDAKKALRVGRGDWG